MSLSDVKCSKCGRVFGQREGSTFYQSGIKVKFNKSARITCHFVGCGQEQNFEVNRQKPFDLLKNNLDKKLCLT